ncbi:MAG: fructose-1,6-bisphosphatase [Duncaniella sp.]|nr:fructose-1,6-bisphosphatase [Duncaniella sp.]
MTQHIPAVSASKIEADRRILELLAQTFPDISAASTEIINLEAILNLPKGTEHFVADLHGEHEAFRHLLKNASGNIKRKVTELFGTTMRESEIRRLCALIYYPAEKLQAIKSVEQEQDLEDYYTITLHQLVRVCQTVSSKYTRSKVRKALPKEFAYIIEELLHESASEYDKVAYFNRIIETIITTGQAENFIVSLCNVIQRLSIDQLHILGDIFDRGPGAHIILDTLLDYGSWDIQWGNHDVLWMGAAAGNDCCIANVIRISLRYANLTTLEEGYGINLLPLATFAMETYKDDPCDVFMPSSTAGEASHTEKTMRLMAKMHKAIAVIQFKLEGGMIESHPEWNMGGRRLLDKIDLGAGTVEIEGKTYAMTDTLFPTIDPADPYALTHEERHMLKKLHHSFTVSTPLRRHIDSLFSHGCMYGVYNSNLLFHASMPLNEDGSLREVELSGRKLKGKELMSGIGLVLRSAFNDDTPAADKDYARDYFWYLWCGPDSPLFDKDKMTTFERYFVDDPDARKEEKGWYYKLRDDEKVIDMILDEFGVDGEQRHIINGHVPVRTGKGESPIRAGGKLMVIDGGFAKAYHKTTGIAGYTLIYHSSNFELVEHEPFTSVEDAINHGTDIVRSNKMVEQTARRICVRDTDKGRVLQGQIDELTELLYAFRHGIIKERGQRRSR